jgi:hypothetical protein
MPVTVSDLIHSSFRLIGAIAAGETLETNELNDAFVSLNQMLSSWDTEGASLVGRKRLLITVAGSNSYVLPERPVHIEAASVASGGIDSPLQIVDSAGWEATPEKQATSVYVQKLFCDYAYPTSTVYIAPLPRLGGTLEIWIFVIIPQFATVNDVIDLPPGYEAALRYNLALALLPEYPRSQVDPTLPAQAQNYKASLVQLNAGNHMRSQTPSNMQAAAADAAQTIAGR